MADILNYSNDGVFQCWTCKNHTGAKIFPYSINDVDSIDRKILVKLPECKVMDKYMLYTNKIPCEKYNCSVRID